MPFRSFCLTYRRKCNEILEISYNVYMYFYIPVCCLNTPKKVYIFWKCKTVLSFVTYRKFRIYLFFLLLRYHNIMFPLLSNSIFRNVKAWDLQVCIFISLTNLRLFRRGWCLYLTVTQSEFFAFIFIIIYSNFAGR